MNLIDYAYTLLKGIKEKKYSFANAVNKKINEMSLSTSEISIIKDALKGVINRYYFLKFEIVSNLKVEDINQIDYLITSLSFARYARNFTITDTIRMMKENYVENSLSFDMDECEKLFTRIGNNPTSIDKMFENVFVKKTSLIYSYPEWLVGMMRKHYGSKNAYKTIASSRRNSPINITPNLMIDDQPINDKNFVKTAVGEYTYEYIGKEPLINNELFKKHHVFVMDQVEQKLVDVLEVMQGDKILLIGENKAVLANAISMRIFDMGKVYYAALTMDSYYNAIKINDQFKLNSNNTFESSINLLCTHLEYASCDKVLVIPPSSDFGLIRRKPEILVTFNQADLDGIIENEKRYLDEASLFTKKGGTLLYATQTLNIKENDKMVRSFLSEHEDFELVEELTLFPFVYQTTGMYYAKLQRKKDEVEQND